MSARIRKALSRHIDAGRLPGAIAAVGRHGKIDVEVLGARSFGGPPLARDALFRITSMTKPVTAVAAMTLVEDCVLRLDDPVDELLPELADRRVLRTIESELDDTVPANRSITLRDLLTFRCGFGHLGPEGEDTPVIRAANDRALGMGPPSPGETPPPDEWMRRLGELPLMSQPGEKWHYHTGMDIAGVLIARAAGKPLEEYLRERVFEPLGMSSTFFGVPESETDRLLPSYGMGDQVWDEAAGGAWSKPPAFPSGGAGLVSTVDDFLAFGEMMLNHGRFDGERILSRPTVELMTTDQLTPEQKAVSGFFPGFFDSLGWGFGMSVVTRRVGHPSVGQYGWDGGFGTSWHNDPREGVVGLLFTQSAGFPQLSPVWQDFWTSVYTSLED